MSFRQLLGFVVRRFFSHLILLKNCSTKWSQTYSMRIGDSNLCRWPPWEENSIWPKGEINWIFKSNLFSVYTNFWKCYNICCAAAVEKSFKNCILENQQWKCTTDSSLHNEDSRVYVVQSPWDQKLHRGKMLKVNFLRTCFGNAIETSQFVC